MSVAELQETVKALESKMKLMELQNGAGGPSKTAGVMPGMGMSEVMSVALKLPLFYEDRPEMWFYFAESQFRLRKITEDQTQFDHIWQSLSTAQASRVESLMMNPPKSDKVGALKKKLLTIFGRTQYEKDNDLLSHGPLGDMTVLEFVGKIESLNKDPATFLHAFLLNKLPSDVRSMLANTEFASMTELALAADKIIKAQKTKSINKVESKVKFPEPEESGEIDAVGKFTGKGRQTSSSGKSGQKTRLAPGQKGTCFYHEKHGPKAFKCEGGGCVWAHTPLAAAPSGNGPAGR